MFDFTDDEKEKLRSEFDREHPNIPEDQRETEFKAYLAEKLRAKLDAQKNNQDNNEVLDADELLPEAKEDNGWKEEVKKAVKQANAFFKEKSPEFQEFTENPDPERPDHLFFKDAKNNTIAFASKQQAYVEGEQAAFDELVVTAQKLGKDTINFGKFEKHPEYKARLYLACLKHGMEMKNAPEIEELKEYPEYKEIRKRQKENLSKELENTDKKYNTIMASIGASPSKKYLLDTWIETRKKLTNKPTAENRKAYNAAQEKLYKECPDFKVARETCQKLTREINKINMEQLNDARKAHEDKKDASSKAEYKKALEEATNFYIEHGSGKENDNLSQHDRTKMLENHVKSDEHGVAEQGKTRNTYTQERMIIKEVLNRRNSR